MLKKIVIPLLIIAFGIGLFVYFESNPVKAQKHHSEKKKLSYKVYNVEKKLKEKRFNFSAKAIPITTTIYSEIEGIVNLEEGLQEGSILDKYKTVLFLSNNELDYDYDKLKNQKKDLLISINKLKDEIKNKKKELKLTKIKSTKYLLKKDELESLQLDIKNKELEMKIKKADLDKKLIYAADKIKISSLNVRTGEYVSNGKELFSYVNMAKSYYELSLPSFITDFKIKDYAVSSTYSELDTSLNKQYLLEKEGFVESGTYVKIPVSYNLELYVYPKKYVYNGFVLTKEKGKFEKAFVSINMEDDNYIYSKDNFKQIYIKE